MVVRPGFDSRQGQEIFSTPGHLWGAPSLLWNVKRPGCEADHSPRSIVEVKNDVTFSLDALAYKLSLVMLYAVFFCGLFWDASVARLLSADL
jgi:hypothetical protein